MIDAHIPTLDYSSPASDRPADLQFFPLVPPFPRYWDNAWRCNLPFEFEGEADTVDHRARSNWVLFEDGRRIGWPHAKHLRLAEAGSGLCSHWNSFLLFSTSDNSDPNTNGRRYSLAAPAAERPWLPELVRHQDRRAARLNARRPDGASGCQGALLVHGASFCGSTLLNLMLNAHSQIFGASELRWLLDDENEAVCAACGPECSFWRSAPRYANGQPTGLYDWIARQSGKPVICDSSKEAAWLEAVRSSQNALKFTNVLLLKHPLRHVASYVSNIHGESSQAAIDDALDNLTVYYEQFARRLDKLTFIQSGRGDGDNIYHVVRYEDLVQNPVDILTRILARAGLEYEPEMQYWAEMPMHPIGGNVGPLVQAVHASHATDSGRIKYQRRGVFMDDSYKKTLTLDQQQYILDSEFARKVMRPFY